MNCLRAILSAFRPANRGEWSLLLTGINLMQPSLHGATTGRVWS
jgi:hypothetical protein